MTYAITQLLTNSYSISPPRAKVCGRLAAITDLAIVILVLAGVGAFCGLQLDHWKIIAIAAGSAGGVLISTDLLTLLFGRGCGQARRKEIVTSHGPNRAEPSDSLASEEESSLQDHNLIVEQSAKLTRSVEEINQIIKKIQGKFTSIADLQKGVSDFLDESLAYFSAKTGSKFDEENMHKKRLEAFVAASNGVDLNLVSQACQSYLNDLNRALVSHLIAPISAIFEKLQHRYDLYQELNVKESKYNLNFVESVLREGSKETYYLDAYGRKNRVRYDKNLSEEYEFDSDKKEEVWGLKWFLTTLSSDGPQNLLADEYAIYLAPQWSFFYATAEELFKFVSNDPDLKEAIVCFQFVLNFIASGEVTGFYPQIVLQCRHKDAAKLALNSLYWEFKDRGCRWGSNKFSSFTCHGEHPLIGYQQGNHAYKDYLYRRDPELFKQLYDEGGWHYHPQFGDYVLYRPDEFNL